MMWGRIHAGSAANAIPQVGVIEGTLRALDENGWRTGQQLIPELISQIVQPFGVGVEVSVTAGVPPAVNHHARGRAAEPGRRVACSGPRGVTATDQSLGGEDFAWMLRQVPGAMARLGVRPVGRSSVADIHQPTFDVDEECIRVGVATLAAVASRPTRARRLRSCIVHGSASRGPNFPRSLRGFAAIPEGPVRVCENHGPGRRCVRS